MSKRKEASPQAMNTEKQQKKDKPSQAKIDAKFKVEHPWQTVRRIFSYFRYNKGLFILSLLLLVASTLLVVGSNAMLSPIVDAVAVDHDLDKFLHMLLIMGIMVACAAIAEFFALRLNALVGQRTIYIIRKELNEKLLKLPISFFDSHSSGELMSTFTNDIDVLMEALHETVAIFLMSIISFVGTMVMMIVLSWQLTLIVLAFLLGLYFLLRFITNRSGAAYAHRQQSIAAMNGYVEEGVSSQRVVKLFNHEAASIQDFDQQSDNLAHASVRASTYGVVAFPLSGNLSQIMYAVIAVFGAFSVVQGAMSIGNITAFLQYSQSISRPITNMAQELNLIYMAMAGADRIFALLDTPEEETAGSVRLREVKQEDGKRQWVWSLEREGQAAQVLAPVKGDVRFNQVNFSYEPDKPILKDVSLYAKPGQKIAFVGSTGAGKTTITNLINAFYTIDSGMITVDGIDINTIDKIDLRSILSMVLQDVNLFQGTIADNIRFGRLDATDEEVVAAAKMANADGFIRRLKDGYNTVISNQAGSLSQGERQLISIARAAVANPVILVLDEATSSVDTRTEHLISQGMDALMQGRTTFVIAHRLSTVRDANAIIVLEHGQIVERGDHDELMDHKGRYYRLNVGSEELD